MTPSEYEVREKGWCKCYPDDPGQCFGCMIEKAVEERYGTEGRDYLQRYLGRAEASGEVPEDEILQIIGYAKQKMKRDLNPVDSYERYCERIKEWLADRHPSTEGDDE